MVSPPNRDKLTMRMNSLKTLNLILSSSKDGAKISCFFCGLAKEQLAERDEIEIRLYYRTICLPA